MKKFLLLPALCWYSIALAQTKPIDCTAIKTENTALKEKIVAYEARLGINAGGVSVVDGNDKLKVNFLSCKASKSTHKAVFKFMIRNTDEPIKLIIWGQNGNASGIKSSFIDEQGQGLPIEKMLIGTQQVGYGYGSTIVPSKVSIQCSIEISTVPSTTTNLSSVILSFQKEIPGMNQRTDFFSGLQNVPITWAP